MKELGGNIRRERVSRQITQEQLAERSGLHPRSIQKTEAGDLNLLITTLGRIQAVLGCSWSSLLGPEAQRPAPVTNLRAVRANRTR